MVTATVPAAVADWIEAVAGAPVSTADWSSCQRLIVVAAHPDDETLGAGALLASAEQRGIPTTVVVATDGEASHPDSPSHTAEQLAEVRRGELGAALRELAPSATLQVLGLADAGLPACAAALLDTLAALVGDSASGTWLVAPWTHDGHCDHDTLGAVAEQVARRSGAELLQYPLWAWEGTSPAEQAIPLDRLGRVEVAVGAVAAKRRALAEYHSQFQPLSPAAGDEAVVPQTLLALLDELGELYVRTETPSDDVGPDAEAGTAKDRDTAAGREALPASYFDDLYGRHDDPWSFDTSWYERRKRALTLAALPRERFRSAFEPGCSIGTLTEGLAQRCERLLSTDVSARALDLARQRLRGRSHVEFELRSVPGEWPDGTFDLIVLSEMAYYLDSSGLDQLIDAAVAAVDADGALVACHWRHPVTDYPIPGDAVHDRLRQRSGLAVLAEHLEEDFRLDVLVRPPAVSIATAEGKA